MNLTDIHLTTLTLAGRAFQLAPLTAAMADEARRVARSRRDHERSVLAARAGLTGEELAQAAGADAEGVEADDIITVLWLRTRHAGVTLEDLQGLPLAELLRHRGAILEDTELERIAGEAAARPVLSALDLRRCQILRAYPGYTLASVRELCPLEMTALLRYLDYEAGDVTAAGQAPVEVHRCESIGEALRKIKEARKKKEV